MEEPKHERTYEDVKKSVQLFVEHIMNSCDEDLVIEEWQYPFVKAYVGEGNYTIVKKRKTK